MNTTESIDTLIVDARTELETLSHDDTTRLREFASWQTRQRGTVQRVQRTAAVAGVLWALQLGYSIWGSRLGVFGPQRWSAIVVLVVPVLVLWAAVALAGRSSLRAQILSRTLLLWSAMVGGATSLFQNIVFDDQIGLGWSEARVVAPVLLALLLASMLGEHGLTTPRRTRERGGFDMVLSLSLVMGLADALFLTFVAALTLGRVPVGPWPFVLPLVLGASAYGLYRGRVWGLLLMAVANLAEVLLALDGSLVGTAILTSAAGGVLVLTATIQLLLPIPVYTAMLAPRRSRVERLQALDASLARVLAVVLGVLLLLGSLATGVVAPILTSGSPIGVQPRG